MQSTKKAPARREDGAAPPSEETASTGSPAAQQTIPQQVITEMLCYTQSYKYCQFVFLLRFVWSVQSNSFLSLFPFTPPFTFSFWYLYEFSFSSTTIMLFCCFFFFFFSPVLLFQPSLFPINCCFAFVCLVSHFSLLQTEMEEDPQNKENKVKQGNQVTHSFPKLLIIPSQELFCL